MPSQKLADPTSTALRVSHETAASSTRLVRRALLQDGGSPSPLIFKSSARKAVAYGLAARAE